MREAELLRRGLEGFSEEDYERWVRTARARRRDITAGALELQEAGDIAEMARVERRQVGETRRVGMREAGLGERLGVEHEFARPEQAARIGEIGARARGVRATAAGEEFGLKFKKEIAPATRDLIEMQRELGIYDVEKSRLDIRALRKGLEDPRAPVAKAEVAVPTAPAGVAKPTGRRLRPSMKRFLWEGTPTRTGLRLPGLLAPAYGYKNIADWLGAFAKKGYEYAYPKGR